MNVGEETNKVDFPELGKGLFAPEYESVHQKILGDVLRGQVKVHPLLGKISQRTTRHSAPSRTVIDSQTLDLEGGPSELLAVMERSTVRSGEVEANTAMFSEMAEIHLGNMFSMLVSHLSRVTEATGLQEDLGGREVTHDDVIDMMEKLEMAFEDDGTPHTQDCVLPPAIFERLSRTPRTAAQNERWAAIVDRKRIEWFAKQRKRRMKLVE